MTQPRSYEEIRNAVERQIREAIERGEFDNLPMEGKKLNLNRNPFIPEEVEIANRILKDNNFIPESVERRKKIEGLRRTMDWETREPFVRRLAEQLAGEVKALNRSLSRENDFIRTSLQMALVDVEEEVRKICGSGK